MGFETQRERDALDRHITGNYGEDQYPEQPVMTAVVYWNDGVANDWTQAVTGEQDQLDVGLRELSTRGRDAGTFWMQYIIIRGNSSVGPIAVEPTTPIEDFLALPWGFKEPEPEVKVAFVTIEYTDGSEAKMEFSGIHEPLEQSGTEYSGKVRTPVLEDAISEAVTRFDLWPKVAN